MTGTERWPAAGRHLLDELAGSRDRYALISTDTVPTDPLVDRVSTDLDLGVVRLGPTLAELYAYPPWSNEIISVCGSGTLLTDLDVLLWPALGIQMLPLLSLDPPTGFE